MGSVGAASLCKSPRADKTAIVIWKIFQIVLWIAAGAYGVAGVLTITGALGGSREADLQAPGRDGTTLLHFAVTQSWQRPELVESVKTLLSLGADPNYTNGHRDSFALANAVHGSARLLQSMLDAGGNPNARDEFGRPI